MKIEKETLDQPPAGKIEAASGEPDRVGSPFGDAAFGRQRAVQWSLYVGTPLAALVAVYFATRCEATITGSWARS